jgi:NAD(P)-dependent dehydrogenase (short-subunit alcohol dehydrogenase family)
MRRAGAVGVVLDLPDAIGVGDGPWLRIAADVTDDESVRIAVASAVRVLGGLDGAVLAAGIVPPWHRTAELDLDEWDRVLAVNVRGVASCMKHVAPTWRRARRSP